MNCVLDSMRKSLNTECRRLSVALVSWIRPSNCFSISCVLDNILWEKSCRKRNNCRDKKQKTFSLYNTAASAYNMKHECFPLRTPESAASDQFVLDFCISSSVQGLSHTCSASPLWLLGPFSIKLDMLVYSVEDHKFYLSILLIERHYNSR